jgi:hypothetical protein
MKYKEYYNLIDKSNFQTRGVWDTEPDKIQFQDTETGLPCLIRRSQSGALCGYVGVTQEHPYFDKDVSDWEFNHNLDVHGGITYNNFCIGDEKTGICHVVDEGENANVYWLGWDAAHLGDFVPSYDSFQHGESVYRDINYVKNECGRLAKQLVEIGSAG